MIPLGNVSSRQADLRNKLLEWRSTLATSERISGFSERKENQVPSNVDSSSQKLKVNPVDSMVNVLHVELERLLTKEQQDERIRAEEKSELLQLRAERENLLMESFKNDTLKESLQLTQKRLELAMNAYNELNFEKSCAEEQVKEWKNKISTYTSNINEMKVIRDREKDIIYRARKDREREVKLLKDVHNKEIKSLLKEKKELEQNCDEIVLQLNLQMEKLHITALDKIAQLEEKLAQSCIESHPNNA